MVRCCDRFTEISSSLFSPSPLTSLARKARTAASRSIDVVGGSRPSLSSQSLRMLTPPPLMYCGGLTMA